MQIIINGKEKEFSGPIFLQAVIRDISRDPRHVIAEVNGRIVKNPVWPQTLLQEGDRVELVTMVGGG